MVPPESETSVEKISSASVEVKEQLVSSKDHKISTTDVPGASSLKSQKGVQGEASFMGKGGEQQFGYQANVYASQPQTFFSGEYLNHLGQWEEYPHVVSAEGFDATSAVMNGAYSPVSTIGDSPSYFSLHYPLLSPYYQPPGSPRMEYSNSAIGISQFDPKYQYYFPDRFLFPATPGFYQPFGYFNNSLMQLGGIPGVLGEGNITLTSGMHQESMYGSGPYRAQQGGRFGDAASRCGFSTFNKGFKHEKGPLHFLNEQSRGPRAAKEKKQVDSPLAEEKNKKTMPIVDPEQYNHPDFVTEYKDIKFFVIKSYTEDHVHKSLKYGVWASTATGNRKLNTAYCEAKEKEDPCPIFLFFSVNGSGQFCGVAEMIGPVDFDKTVDFWQNDRWSGNFPVKWHIVKDVPNNLFRHIILENNENKPVTNSRDTQEVKLEQGLQMLAIFKNHEAETTILEDFDFYEQREKAMLDSRQQQKLHCAGVEAQNLVEAGAPVDLMTIFERTVQLQETKGKETRQEEAEDTVRG
ncbi:hypothetical protein ACP70R_010269 [Stipagrostis hirtigluma subsp. patula]